MQCGQSKEHPDLFSKVSGRLTLFSTAEQYFCRLSTRRQQPSLLRATAKRAAAPFCQRSRKIAWTRGSAISSGVNRSAVWRRER